MADAFQLNSDYYRIPGEYTHGGVYYCHYVRKDILENPELLKIKPDDCFVVSYPKSGTTWTLELAYLIMNNGDTSSTEASHHFDRIPFIEYNNQTVPQCEGLKMMENMKSPRLLKSHLPVHHFPTEALQMGCKIIVVARNPKDTAVSYYHFYKALKDDFGNFEGGFSDYLKLFMNNKVVHGDWFDHTLGWWKYVRDNNILFLKYEDMTKNPRDATVKIAEYLNYDLSGDVIDKITDYCSFDKMKTNKAVNYEEISGQQFVRKGGSGGWKKHFTVFENEAFEKIYNERMKGSELSFEW